MYHFLQAFCLYHTFSLGVRAGNRNLDVPKTITCNVMSIDMLKALADISLHKDNASLPQASCHADGETSLVLAGLHACGDLSVTMLK